MITELQNQIIQTTRGLLEATEFEAEHREFLEQHEEDYFFVTDPARLCFHDSARLDVIGHFGPDGWTPAPGGYMKKIDGFTIKLLSETATAAPITLAPNKPAPVPSTSLDAIGTDNGKLSLTVTVIHGDN